MSRVPAAETACGHPGRAPCILIAAVPSAISLRERRLIINAPDNQESIAATEFFCVRRNGTVDGVTADNGARGGRKAHVMRRRHIGTDTSLGTRTNPAPVRMQAEHRTAYLGEEKFVIVWRND